MTKSMDKIIEDIEAGRFNLKMIDDKGDFYTDNEEFGSGEVDENDEHCLARNELM